MVARLAVSLAALCALLFLACYLGTGTDKRNMRSIASYPLAVRKALLADPRLAALARGTAGQEPGPAARAASFAGNLVLFTVVLWVAGSWAFAESVGFATAFVGLLVVGEGLNIFDLLVIDLLWWRHSPRVRLSGISDPTLYRDWRPHVAAFVRGLPMFAAAALLAALLVWL